MIGLSHSTASGLVMRAGHVRRRRARRRPLRQPSSQPPPRRGCRRAIFTPTFVDRFLQAPTTTSLSSAGRCGTDFTLKRDQTKAKQVVALDVALRRGAPTDSITICDGGGAVGHDSFMWRLHGV